ncbi:glycyl-radical enzyme activating protein [Oceanotoga sp. DSM 15011]|uniref:trans-4-hydroxy-L-proline dehydratase activase n=1 Tax=Oceanotoga sp. DSM 15011 TaxID=2984951 RepID=UPI0021F3FA2E|nr:trans-4-hydroxy-L-proline dehydratase activase [Oceanotoga sp. DSM 15011]UYP01191.1 glycyl-radical enzyme activating protein [Oceanotoga sp. DSM 15011]
MFQAKVINIQKYSIHDGPGIRTTVFLKGCPLKCWWCHNPESQNFGRELLFYDERCVGCGKCVKRCPNDAISIINGLAITDERCVLCGNCVDFCVNNAREIVGENMSTTEVFDQIIKDEMFYEESSGGITFSGGEPLMHPDFLLEILKKCKSRDIHVAIDTSGYAPWDNFEKIIDYVDLFLYDLKHMDEDKHLKYMGVSNDLVFENLKKLSSFGKEIYIRMPLIHNINDYDKNIMNCIEFLKNIKFSQLNILPYHKMGKDKYRRLNMKTYMEELESPSDERILEIKKMFEDSGIKVKIGG